MLKLINNIDVFISLVFGKRLMFFACFPLLLLFLYGLHFHGGQLTWKSGIVRKFSSTLKKLENFTKMAKVRKFRSCGMNVAGIFFYSFNFTFTEQFLSHFVSHLFHSYASKDTGFHLTVKKLFCL